MCERSLCTNTRYWGKVRYGGAKVRVELSGQRRTIKLKEFRIFEVRLIGKRYVAQPPLICTIPYLLKYENAAPPPRDNHRSRLHSDRLLRLGNTNHMQIPTSHHRIYPPQFQFYNFKITYLPDTKRNPLTLSLLIIVRSPYHHTNKSRRKNQEFHTKNL